MKEIPKYWAKLEIGDIANVIGGGTPKASDESNFAEPGSQISWLTPADLSGYKEKYISYGKRDLSLKGLKSSSAKLMPADSVLFSSRAPIGYVAIASNEISTNQGFKSFVFPKEISPSFAYYYLRSIRSIAESMGTGSTFKELSGASAKKLPFILAPANEQIRIANKLDTLLARVEAAQARLDKIPHLLKRFRQSMLSSATSGELTKDWRNNNLIIPVDIQELDITNDPYGIWQKSTRTAIPDSWKYCKLAQVGKLQGGGTPTKSNQKYWGGAIPWITPKDMKVDFIERSKLMITPEGVKNSSVKLLPKNSILFVVRGMILAHSFPVALNTTKVTVNQDMKCISPNNFLLPEYLLFTLKSLKNVFVDIASSSTHGTKRLEPNKYLNVAIPIPNLKEQQEIGRRIDSLLALADTVEKQYLDAKKRIDRLTQAILAKAFRGELVPQDPNDEPASELLKRIQAERAEKPLSRKARKKKARS